jgi:hypothetical protein
VKRQNCSWCGAERDRRRVVVGRQTRGRQVQKVQKVKQDTALKKLARDCERVRAFSSPCLEEC